MPKTLILSDIHEDWNYVQKAEERAKEADAVVCLGDYWDSWAGITENTHLVTDWVKKKIHDPKWTLLWGNHDLHYAFDIRGLRCSGYSDTRKQIIRPHFRLRDWSRLKFHTWVDSSWLLSHAGLVTIPDLPGDVSIAQYIHETEADVRKALGAGQMHPWLEAGYARGGRHGFGGIVWTDWRDMRVVLGINQLVGHSEGYDIRRKTMMGFQSVCMDTQRRHLAWLENDELSFEQVKN